MKKILNTLPSVLTFAVLFSLLGTFIPQTYYQFFDTTEYYKIAEPVEIEDRDYFACDYVNAYITRTSLIDGHGDSIINLSLVREDTGEVVDRIVSSERHVTITQGTGTVITHWEIPCNADPGSYHYDGVVEYEVRGIKKHEGFVSEVFTVAERSEE